MRRRIAATVSLLVSVAAACPAGTPKPVTVTFYHTSDLHDHSGPLPRIARLVADHRRKDENTIFVDTGDWMNKGDLTPLETRGEAVVEMMGAMGYDAVIPGNHDFTFGAGRLVELVNKHRLPLLAANCRWHGDARPRNAPPYRVHRLKGVTVAIIGTAPPFVGAQKGPSVEILPIADAVRDLVAELDHKADIIVLLTHVGPPEDRKLIRALPRVDIVFGGHHHKRFAKLDYDKGTKTVLQHSGCFGDTVGEVIVTWDGKRITDRRSRLVRITRDMPESEAVKAIREKYVPAKAPAGAR
jgi:2',3'-cyclic-nucleotide 2'-phosphodiesterase (5'-nucleotidase family)